MEIVQFVNSVFESNTYLIISDDYKICFLIDCGDVDVIINNIKKLGLSLKGIFITHSHFDHIYGLNSLVNEYPKVSVYTSAFGKMGLCSDKLNLSRYNLHPFIFRHNDNIKVVNEGASVNFYMDTKIEVIETPGHDKSCLTYNVNEILFTGDSFIPGSKVVTSFPNSNKEDAEVSRLRILSLSESCKLYPGHGGIYETFQPEAYL